MSTTNGKGTAVGKGGLLRRIALAAVVALGFGIAPAGAQIITNGGFDGTAGVAGSAWGQCVGCSNGSIYTTTQQVNGTLSNGTDGGLMSGWTTSSDYTFALTASQAIIGFAGQSGNLSLWSPTVGAVTGNGGSGSVAITASPNGGNFLAVDPSYLNTTTLSGSTIAASAYTTMNSLVTGATYVVSFQAASAQQSTFSLDATVNPNVRWTVAEYTAGGTAPACTPPNTGATLCQNAPTIGLINHGFSGWVQQQVTFVAAATQMTLAFIASSNVGSGQPPFALLDGVTVTQQVPEPASAALLLVGLGGLLGLRRRASKKAGDTHVA